jgi:hypothetical protein
VLPLDRGVLQVDELGFICSFCAFMESALEGQPLTVLRNRPRNEVAKGLDSEALEAVELAAL